MNTTTAKQNRMNHWNPLMDLRNEVDRLMDDFWGMPADQQLLIAGERKYEDRKNQNDVMYSERHYGRFQRVFSLPAGLDVEKVEANYQDGVLRVVVPKVESAKPRQIKIGTGNSTSFFGKLIGQASSKEKEVEPSFSARPSDKIAS